ncbi:hypothetical protein K3A88_19425 [Streptomyces geysiriensis]|nr:hypothetical protein [Streptomyces geysiriensis]MBX4176993.1 hypothetical protein [Streptomyces geysiriensis]
MAAQEEQVVGGGHVGVGEFAVGDFAFGGAGAAAVEVDDGGVEDAVGECDGVGMGEDPRPFAVHDHGGFHEGFVGVVRVTQAGAGDAEELALVAGEEHLEVGGQVGGLDEAGVLLVGVGHRSSR